MIRSARGYHRRVVWTAGDPPRPRPVLLAKAEVLELTGAWPEAEALHRNDCELSPAGGGDAAGAARCLARLLMKRGAYDEARPLLVAARGYFETSGDRRRLFGCHMDLGQLLRRQGQPDASDAEYDAGLTIARGLGDHSLESHALLDLGINRYTRGDFSAAELHYIW